ncbi:1-phosphofructokinase [Telmatospirillum siberiense]|uniref:Phosphofructokinase n=1 Tax=Telmatospirillum siberiense TaxID=382514 RepID=A0A2N3PXE0_9PROT|nr:1-phosphofructokinase [Telmatospirillum siberiense]PKU25069.1 1-phosphofructokinase [Telmatospirillum siberiense]
MKPPVVTVTLNPAIDQTITLDRLRPGSVHRARAVRFDAGGKGVNVASCLADWGVPVSAAGILGKDNDGLFKALFAAKNIDDRFVRTAGDTRVNIKLVHDGDTTDINLPGLEITPDVFAAVTTSVLSLVRKGSLAVLAGSLPAGTDVGIYRELTAALSGRGARVLLDTSGAPMKAALADGVRLLPYCVKPNRAELEGWIGHPLPDMASLVGAARVLLARGVRLVVVSLGEEGALFVSDAATLQASLSAVACASTVGAGDAMVAGIVAASRDEAALEDIARLATAFAVSKLGQAGPNLPPRWEVEARAADVTIIPLNDL